MITKALAALMMLFSFYFFTEGTPTRDIEVSHEAEEVHSARVISVIDGDTIDVLIEGEADTKRVRYIGIDTPEPHRTGEPECGSAEATERNRALVAGQPVKLVLGEEQTDRFGRTLAYVYVGDTFVNRAMVAEGYATVLMLEPNTKYEQEFRQLYTEAINNQKGIWSRCRP